jgi:hypothetical protein
MVLGFYPQNITLYYGVNRYINEYNLLATNIDSVKTMEDCYVVGNALRDFIKRHTNENAGYLAEALHEQTYNIFTK